MPPDDLCSICGEKVPGFSLSSVSDDETMRLCGQCQRARPPFLRAVAFGAYEGALRELLHRLKYEGLEPAAAVLGRLLATAAQPVAARSEIIVPVPLHRARFAQRGFNQSELLAESAARRLHLQLALNVLKRTRDTGSQTGLTRHQRRANLKGAFALQQAHLIAGKSVLLVDDVMTTGATAAECAKVLLRGGARQVFVATVARVHKTELATHFTGSLETLERASGAGTP